MELGTFEAKNRLSELLDMVERGEEVTITRHGKPVARLVAPNDGAEHKEKARQAVEKILQLRKQAKPLGDLTIKELVNEGRRF